MPNDVIGRQKQPPELFYKKDVLKNLTKFTGIQLCQRLSFNKVVGLTPFLQNTSGRLLLDRDVSRTMPNVCNIYFFPLTLLVKTSIVDVCRCSTG